MALNTTPLIDFGELGEWERAVAGTGRKRAVAKTDDVKLYTTSYGGTHDVWVEERPEGTKKKLGKNLRSRNQAVACAVAFMDTYRNLTVDGRRFVDGERGPIRGGWKPWTMEGVTRVS